MTVRFCCKIFKKRAIVTHHVLATFQHWLTAETCLGLFYEIRWTIMLTVVLAWELKLCNLNIMSRHKTFCIPRSECGCAPVPCTCWCDGCVAAWGAAAATCLGDCRSIWATPDSSLIPSATILSSTVISWLTPFLSQSSGWWILLPAGSGW